MSAQIHAASHMDGGDEEEYGRFEGYFRSREKYWWESYYYGDTLADKKSVAFVIVRCPQPASASSGKRSTIVKITLPDKKYRFKQRYVDGGRWPSIKTTLG